MEKSAHTQGKTVAEKQGAFFLGLTRKLGWKAAPTRQELDQVAQQLGWRLKRKPGVTAAQELSRRKRARGTFARGWVAGKIEQSGTRIRIWIYNFVDYAKVVEDKKHPAQQAATMVQREYKSKLQRLAERVTSVFGK